VGLYLLEQEAVSIKFVNGLIMVQLENGDLTVLRSNVRPPAKIMQDFLIRKYGTKLGVTLHELVPFY